MNIVRDKKQLLAELKGLTDRHTNPRQNMFL